MTEGQGGVAADSGKAAAGQAAAEHHGPRREILLVLPGLLLTIIIAMLDQLVVATALPRIVGDLHGVSHLAWVVTAYILASTVTTLLYGKLGDQYGRKRWLMIAIVVFLIGSALSGLSRNMDQLITFRALQGLGAGGLMVGAIAAISDLVSPRERGQYIGFMSGAMTLAMIAGPLVGGGITDAWGWRWIFYINMPVGAVALLYLHFTLHLPHKRVQHKIDYMGAVVTAIGATAIVLLTTWGGTTYGWGSWQVLLLGAIILTMLALFFMTEARAAEPILPLQLFKVRNFSLTSAMSFLLGLAMLGAMTFLPFYQQTVQHLSPTGSGLMLIPMMLGATVTSLVAGLLTTRTGRYKAFPIAGALVLTAGLYLLMQLGPATSTLRSAWIFVVFGLGLGCLMQITTLIVQNSVPVTDMGVASSSRTFFQQIGGSVGVSLYGVIFIRRIDAAMAAKLPGAHITAGSGQFDPVTINSLPEPIRSVAFFAVSHGLDAVFGWTIPAVALVFVLALAIKEIPLRGRAEYAADLAQAQRTLVPSD